MPTLVGIVELVPGHVRSSHVRPSQDFFGRVRASAEQVLWHVQRAHSQEARVQLIQEITGQAHENVLEGNLDPRLDRLTDVAWNNLILKVRIMVRCCKDWYGVGLLLTWLR